MNDNRLDQTPTAEVQGLRRDIGASPSVRGELSSGGTSRRSATNMESSPDQRAELLRQSQEVLANQQELRVTPGAAVQQINTPVNQTGLTNVQTVPVERRQVSRTNASFGTTATGGFRQSGMSTEPRANTRQPTNNLGIQQRAFQGVGIAQSQTFRPEFVASMDYSGGGQEEEKSDQVFEETEIELNYGDADGTRTRSNNVEVPGVARSGIEDSSARNQQLGVVMTQGVGLSSRRQASGTYQPRLEDENRMERMAIGLSPVTGDTGRGDGSGGTYQSRNASTGATHSGAPATVGGLSDQQWQDNAATISSCL